MNAELKPFDFVLIGYLCLLTLLNWSTMVLILRTISKHENHFVNQTVRFQVQLEADGYFSAREVFAFAVAASRASWFQLAIF